MKNRMMRNFSNTILSCKTFDGVCDGGLLLQTEVPATREAFTYETSGKMVHSLGPKQCKTFRTRICAFMTQLFIVTDASTWSPGYKKSLPCDDEGVVNHYHFDLSHRLVMGWTYQTATKNYLNICQRITHEFCTSTSWTQSIYVPSLGSSRVVKQCCASSKSGMTVVLHKVFRWKKQYP